jgi:hypothetical protein
VTTGLEHLTMRRVYLTVAKECLMMGMERLTVSLEHLSAG